MSIAIPTDTGYDHIVEINLRRFTVLAYPRVRYINASTNPQYIFVSRTATVLELHTMLCQKFADDSDNKWTAEELLNLSRLWKLEGNEMIDDAKQMLSDI